jgi:hypothetical protein
VYPLMVGADLINQPHTMIIPDPKPFLHAML